MMRRRAITLWMLGGLVLGSTAAWSAVPPKSAKPQGPRVKDVTVEIRHRVFQNFLEHDQVRLGVTSPIGDTDYSFRIVDYVPDFAMDLKNHKVITRSPEPNNPAFRIVVRMKNKPQDTTWAMIKMPPHFARKSMLAFKVTRIDFVGHAPILAPDSTAVAGKEAKP